MTKLEALIEEARGLSPADRVQLAKALLEEATPDAEIEEEGLALRGLLAWGESSDEDWSEFYPKALKAQKSKPA